MTSTEVELVSDGLLGIPQRWRELGRIRLGTKNEKGFPTKLASWRLTSPNKVMIEEAADLYGGTVNPWARDGASEWEVITTTDTLDVLIPPVPASFRQSWELWTANGCQRDCDGITDRKGAMPCQCPADIDQRREMAQKGNACKPITRLAVVLPQMSGLGIWQLSTTGRNAAGEFAALAPILRQAMRKSITFRCSLRLEQRSVKLEGKPRQDFVVPVVDIPVKLGMILDDLGMLALGEGTPPGMAQAPAVTAAASSGAAGRLLAPAPPLLETDDEVDTDIPAGPDLARSALDAAKRLR